MKVEKKSQRRGTVYATNRHRWGESSFQTGDRREFWDRVAERQRLINWKIPRTLN